MSDNVELIPMFCTKCQNAIPAGIHETAWVCGQCGQGLLLSDDKGVIHSLFVLPPTCLPEKREGRSGW